RDELQIPVDRRTAISTRYLPAPPAAKEQAKRPTVALDKADIAVHFSWPSTFPQPVSTGRIGVASTYSPTSMSIMIRSLPDRHRTTVDEYRRMGEAGIFAPDTRVELIAGEIIDMPPIGSRHAAVVERFARRFHPLTNGFL